jgi:hypothetical protein
MSDKMIFTRQLPKSVALILGANLVIAGLPPQAVAQNTPVSSVGNNSSVTFNCNDSEATIKAKNGPRVVFGTTAIYIGYQQVSSINQDPRIIRFDNGVRIWCRNDYETTGDDGRGYGLIWDGGDVLYGVFSSTGSQTGEDFRRFANKRWLPTYGSGGGPQVAVIARINPANGDVNYASFLTAIRPSDGNTNSLQVTGLAWNGSTLTVQANSWWLPRRADKTSMSCSGSSPYNNTVVFNQELTTVNSASATGCS